MKITRFEDLECWQEAREVVNRIYRVCGVEGFNRDYSLTDQIKRASVSAMANIAEGFSRRSNREFIRFLFIAKSSAAELQSHLYVALDRGYITKQQFDELYLEIDKIQRQLSSFIKYLGSTLDSTRPRERDKPNKLDKPNKPDKLNEPNKPDKLDELDKRS